MPNDHKSDKSENSQLKGDDCVAMPQPKDVVESQNAGARQIDQVEATRTNRHNGSAGGEQELSIEIDFGDGRKASRTNALSESSTNLEKDLSEVQEQTKSAPQEVFQNPMQIGGITYDPLSVIAKGTGDKAVVTDATNAKAHKPEAQAHKLEKHLEKAHKVQEKPTAPEGKDISLSDFFHKYSSPFADAYNRSKALKPGERGKSPTLEAIVDRMMSVPWANQLKVRIDNHATNSVYRDSENALVISPNSDPTKYLQNAGHEAYHASHQYLSKLYGEKMPTKEQFVEVKVNSEVDAFISEMAIRHELGAKESEPVNFTEDKWPLVDTVVNLEEMYKRRGREALFDYLKDAKPGFFKPSYGEHFANSYEQYSKAFEADRASAVELIKKWQLAGNDPLDL